MSRPFFAGEEKRPVHASPEKWGCRIPFLDRSLPLYARICTTESQMNAVASSPGSSFRGEGKEPGIHCMRMRVIAAEFRGDRILSEYARIFMTSLTSAMLVVARFLVCPPCYNEETEGLGLYRRFATLRE